MPPESVPEWRHDRIRLQHMLEAALRVKEFCTGMDQQRLSADEMRLLAVVKLIEVIGEASTKVGTAMQTKISASIGSAFDECATA